MKCIIDDTCFPPELRLEDSVGSVKGKKQIQSLQAGVDEVFDSYTDQLQHLPMRRMVQKAIDVFNPEQIIFEEK